jgi:hypothetical protein
MMMLKDIHGFQFLFRIVLTKMIISLNIFNCAFFMTRQIVTFAVKINWRCIQKEFMVFFFKF